MRKFIIKNYKNIGVDKEVFLDIPDQGGLCVILGENNAGKSNVLGALKSFGKKNLTENDIPNYYFSGFNNGQYETEISLSSDNFFNEGKKETIDYKKYKTQSDEKFEIIPPSVIEKEFYINKFALAFNKKTMDGVIKTSGLSEGDVIKQYNEELLSEPVVFAYYVNNRIDGKLNIGTIYLYFPKMAKILCAKANNRVNTHIFEVYLIKDYTQIDALTDFTKAIPLPITFEFYATPELAERAVEESGLSDALILKQELQRVATKIIEDEIEESSLKGLNKNIVTYSLSLKGDMVYHSFFSAKDKKSYMAPVVPEISKEGIDRVTSNLSTDAALEILGKMNRGESANTSYLTSMVTKTDSKKENTTDTAGLRENKELLEKISLAAPRVFEFSGKEIKDSDLTTKRDNLENSEFLRCFLEKAGVSLESIEAAYLRKNAELERRGVSRAVKEKEDEINDLIKNGFTKRFNELYYGSKSGEKYNFQILLDEETISLMITRGKNSLALAIQEQSVGFRKFFGMFFDFLFQANIKRGDIILIDEVETHLSIPIQRETRSFLKSFGEEQGITFIVTTHSNYIIDVRNLDEVRIVKPLGEYNGSTIINDFSSIPEHETDTLAEIKKALGINAISLFNKDDRLVFVEGITDYSYLTGMYKSYKEDHKEAPELLFLPICGLGKFDRTTFDLKNIKPTDEQKDIKESLLELAFAAREDKAFLLVDGDRAGSAMAQLAEGDDNFEVASIREVPDFLKMKIKDVEDLFSDETKIKYHMIDKNHGASSELKNDLIAGRYEPSGEEKANFSKLFDFLIERR